ncbi:MAG: hypothetical protein M1298_01160 [Chloroflexi bacterium]|nr:hypothetical protein [Chloroflexota bacterium]
MADSAAFLQDRSRSCHRSQLALFLALALLLVIQLPTVRVAPASFFVLLSTIPGVPAGPISALLGTPRVQTFTVKGAEGAIVSDLYLPPGGGRHPGIFIVNGLLPQGRKYPPLVEFAKMLARTGYVVLVPDFPDLLREELTPASFTDVRSMLRRFETMPQVRPGDIDYVGFCVGATLGLLALERSPAPPIRALADLAGYASNASMIQLITTNTYTYHGRLYHYKTDPWVVVVVARSLVALLPTASDKTVFQPFLHDPSPSHYVAPNWYRVPKERLSPGGRALLRLLQNRDPSRVAALIAALPAPMPRLLASLSPEIHLSHLHTPVFIVADHSDTYIPNAESLKLRERAPMWIHVSYVSILSHVEPALQAQSNLWSTITDIAGGIWTLYLQIDNLLALLHTPPHYSAAATS